ncbi:GNAT family N-acetyltransferase [Lacticaseibacillus saniviri]|uniref:Alanine acetyl transferase n=1 Tax=Lacticaseibacillus saniviri JCM 17471 = DSM 24301 TaxID=1293598 RepID=A0A0R2MRP2_9LACO|nr:GNAT family N-acetyltransferase [Lacticaseibacillus saniviri]KRO16261.1 alanine acetyl transferase [Lacticaseibacillus saniviri JCM 17471 = DSM 24301]
MAIFEKYHPIMSAHYTLDWLTTFTVKEVFALRHDATIAQQSGREVDTDLTATVHYINRSMHLVMSNQALLYGIKDRETNQFLGSFCIWNFDQDLSQAQIRFELLPEVQHQGVMSEVLARMVEFAFVELGLNQLVAELPAPNSALTSLLLANHFEQIAIHDGATQYRLKRES